MGGRAPCGARGLKLTSLADITRNTGRAPCGARGLKQMLCNQYWWSGMSRPVRGAWIETSLAASASRSRAVAPRAGRVD